MGTKHPRLWLLLALTACAQSSTAEKPTWSGPLDDERDASTSDDDGDGDAGDGDDGDGNSNGDGDSDQDLDASIDEASDASESDSGGCADTDQDGIDDCAEVEDGDDWTDPAIFNGVKARSKGQCSNDGVCSENDSRAKVDACMAGEVWQELNQHAGWDWGDNPPNDLCDQDYGFSPNWTECGGNWQAQWLGFINLKTAGHHCFAITGGADEGCGALFFNTEDAPAQSGMDAKCYDVPAGVYPIMWHYTMDNGSGSTLHVLYCGDEAADCVPIEAMPAALLRVEAD
jgi:hypothetical protein